MRVRGAGRVARMGENKYMCNEFLGGGVNTKKIGHLKNLVGVSGRIILKWMLKKWNGVTGFIGFRIGASGGRL